MTSYFATECHDRLREQVREFAESRVRPLIPEMEAAKTVQHELSRLIARQGWIGVTIGARIRRHGTRPSRQDHHHRGALPGQRRDGRHGAGLPARRREDPALRQRRARRRPGCPPSPTGDCLPTIAVTEPRLRRPRARHGRPPRYATATTTFSMAGRSSSATATSATSTASWSAPAAGSRGPVGVPRGGRTGPACRSARRSSRWACTGSASANCSSPAAGCPPPTGSAPRATGSPSPTAQACCTAGRT